MRLRLAFSQTAAPAVARQMNSPLSVKISRPTRRAQINLKAAHRAADSLIENDDQSRGRVAAESS